MVNVRQNLTGMKFNHLFVIKQADDYISKSGIHYAQWLVKCDCGTSDAFVVRDNDIKNGHSKSCGCIKQRGDTVRSRKDLRGMTFGRLQVLRQADEDYVYPNGKHESKWWVVCACGQSDEFMIRYSHLTGGNTRSCGCLATEARISNGHAKKKYNTYDLSGEYGIGYTDKDEEFWFDIEDYDLIKDYCWYYSDGYLVTNITVDKCQQARMSLHRLIMGFPENKEVDHIIHPSKFGNKFDNRKSNLRIVNKSQNQMNKHKQSNNTSGNVGVSWHNRDNVWEAWISINNQQIYLGRFVNKEDAIHARKVAEDKYFGDYSFTNSGNKEIS